MRINEIIDNKFDDFCIGLDNNVNEFEEVNCEKADDSARIKIEWTKTYVESVTAKWRSKIHSSNII